MLCPIYDVALGVGACGLRDRVAAHMIDASLADAAPAAQAISRLKT